MFWTISEKLPIRVRFDQGGLGVGEIGLYPRVPCLGVPASEHVTFFSFFSLHLVLRKFFHFFGEKDHGYFFANKGPLRLYPPLT